MKALLLAADAFAAEGSGVKRISGRHGVDAMSGKDITCGSDRPAGSARSRQRHTGQVDCRTLRNSPHFHRGHSAGQRGARDGTGQKSEKRSWSGATWSPMTWSTAWWQNGSSSRTAGRGFVLDGFPRTVAQAEWLDRELAGKAGERRPTVVVDVDVSYNQLLQRLTGRRTCPVDGKIYNIYLQPPKNEGVCDVCGTQLFQRVDDTEEVISERLKSYERQTLPLEEYYQKRDACVVSTEISLLRKLWRRCFARLKAAQRRQAQSN